MEMNKVPKTLLATSISKAIEKIESDIKNPDSGIDNILEDVIQLNKISKDCWFESKVIHEFIAKYIYNKCDLKQPKPLEKWYIVNISVYVDHVRDECGWCSGVQPIPVNITAYVKKFETENYDEIIRKNWPRISREHFDDQGYYYHDELDDITKISEIHFDPYDGDDAYSLDAFMCEECSKVDRSSLSVKEVCAERNCNCIYFIPIGS